MCDRAPVVGADSIPELCSQGTSSAKPCRAVTTLSWATSLTFVLSPSPRLSLPCSLCTAQICGEVGLVPASHPKVGAENICAICAASPFLPAHSSGHEVTHSSLCPLPAVGFALPSTHCRNDSLFFAIQHFLEGCLTANVRQQLSWPRALVSLKSPSRKPEGGGNSIWPQEV